MPDGKPFEVVVINRREVPVELFVVTPAGERKSYGRIAAGERNRRRTRPGAVWMVADTAGKPFGYFSVGDRIARAVIPR
ncbi:MAG: hypothetical protein ACJAYX_001976 [Planctomycetota bacterium]|jgi:hypothetical protein